MPIILKVPFYGNTPAAAEATSIALPVAARLLKVIEGLKQTNQLLELEKVDI
jgi:hypothetical protein